MKRPLVLLSAVVGAALLSAELRAQTRPAATRVAPKEPPLYVLDSEGRRARPRLAAPDICAWPNLVALPDGTIVSIVFNQPEHGLTVGGVDCWASTDNGQTWRRRGAVAEPDRPMTNRMNVAAGRTASGDVVVLVGGWELAPRPDDPKKVTLVKPQRPWVCRSSDGGHTWTIDKDGFPANNIEGDNLTPHGSILPGEDGALRVAAHSARGGDKPRWRYSYVCRSDDDGRTWTVAPHPIDPENRRNETFLFHAGAGRWLAAARHKGMDLYESTDDAVSWRRLGQISEDLAYPAHIVRLKDGRLLLANGNRFAGDERIEVRVSADEGRTWSRPRRLLEYTHHDGGYPSSVVLPDGRVVTAYYAWGTDYHQGYHMGVVTWDPAKTFPVR